MSLWEPEAVQEVLQNHWEETAAWKRTERSERTRSGGVQFSEHTIDRNGCSLYIAYADCGQQFERTWFVWSVNWVIEIGQLISPFQRMSMLNHELYGLFAAGVERSFEGFSVVVLVLFCRMWNHACSTLTLSFLRQDLRQSMLIRCIWRGWSWNNKAVILLHLNAISYTCIGKLEEALECFQDAVAIAEDDTSSLKQVPIVLVEIHSRRPWLHRLQGLWCC